jgi:ribosomal peptide maturation radical SAM protein 1
MFELSRMFGEKQARVYGASLNMTAPRVRRGYDRFQQSKVGRLRRLEASAGEWLDRLADAIAARDIPIVGCTTTFEQTACSVALLDRVKRRRPDAVTIIGGANCEGEMADGIASLGAGIDYIFSGESDETFPPFVRQILGGERPPGRIVNGRPCEDMNGRPTPSFQEFFEQRARHLGDGERASANTYLTYETSRGCWWGQKQHCTFCGLNGEGMASRRKDAARVLDELRTLTREHPTRNIGMADNIMPHEYFSTLLPRLSREVPNVHMFYEQKANLSLAQVMALKEAGVTTIQPGIEGLSSPMLRLMKKGVQAWQNLLLLRYVRIAGIRTLWSVLCGFPGDGPDVYRDTLGIIRLIHHLPPPTALWHLTIDRFSPYFTRPDEFAVKNIAPYPAYDDVFPPDAATARLAYHFVAEYDSAADRHLDVIGEIGADLAAWRRRWAQPYGRRPELKIERHGSSYVLADTRGLAGTEATVALSREEAAFLLFHRRSAGTPDEDAAIERKLALKVDGWFVPLPVARIDHLFGLLGDSRDESHQRAQLEQLAARRSGGDVGAALVAIACSGALSALDHPLAPA